MDPTLGLIAAGHPAASVETRVTASRRVRAVIEQTAPNVAVDIYRSGITLTGGGALLRDLDQRLSSELSLPVSISERPLEAVVVGAGQLISNEVLLDRYKLREETLEWEAGNVPSYSLAN